MLNAHGPGYPPDQGGHKWPGEQGQDFRPVARGGSESPPIGRTTDGNFGKEPLKSPAVMYFSRIRRESPIPLAVDNLVIMVSLSLQIRLS